MMTKERNRSLDLMRIICMCMIVLLHACNHGGLMGENITIDNYNFYVVNILFSLCYVAVNCFVMLSGYFQCTSKFKLKRLFSVWVEAAFYSISVYIVLVFVGQAPFSVKELALNSMVTTMKRYWFVTAYLLMYAVSPILNAAIQAMDKKKHLASIIVLLGICSVAENIIFANDFSNIKGGYSFGWFCIIYMTAAYFRLYVPEKVKHQAWMLPMYFIFSLGICTEKFLAYWITPNIFGDVVLETLFYGYNSILCVAASFCLFQFFRGVKVKNKFVNKTILFVSPLTFAVYLISDHTALRSILWNYFKLYRYVNSFYLLFYVLACAILIFAVCCAIEWIRKFLFDKLKINFAVERLCDKIQEVCSEKLQHIV